MSLYLVEKLNNEIVKNVECSGTHGYVKISKEEKFCVMTEKFANDYMDRIKEMEVYEDDVWVVTWMKSGTTWSQEMIWLINNDLDYKKAREVPLLKRYDFIEIGSLIIDMEIDSLEMAKNAQRPRYIKSHLPIFLLPDKLWTIKPQIIYVARNPKDVATSYFHHYRHLHGYRGNRENFLKAFLTDQILYAPMSSHVLDFWKLRNETHVEFIFYEDMKRNLSEVIKIVAKFLRKSITDEDIEELCKHLSFDSMKSNESCNYDDLLGLLKNVIKNYEKVDEKFSFIRKGKVGSSKEELSEEENKHLDEYAKNCEKFGFFFKFA